jgi:anti-sigma B factor antagonist
MDFSINTDDLGDGVKVIALAGEIDLYNAPELKKQLFSVIGEGCKDVVVDFSDATFIDSTTLGVLVGGVKRLRMQEGRLSLICDNKHITSVFEITGLDRVFPIYPNREEALAGSRQPAALA